MPTKKLLEKSNAEEMRRSGHSLSYISSKTGVSRASLSLWLRDIPYVPNADTLIRQKTARAKSAQSRNRNRIESFASVKKLVSQDLGTIRDRDLRMIMVGIMAKSGRGLGGGGLFGERVELVTSDGKLARLFVKCLTGGLNVPQSNVFARLSVSPRVDQEKCRKFWSDTTKIPMSHIKALVQEKNGPNNGQKALRSTRFTSAPFGSIKIYLKNKGQPLAVAVAVGIDGGEKEQITIRNDLGVLLHRKILASIDRVLRD